MTLSLSISGKLSCLAPEDSLKLMMMLTIFVIYFPSRNCFISGRFARTFLFNWFRRYLFFVIIWITQFIAESMCFN